MLISQVSKGLISPLHNALGADVDPGSGGHLPVHHQAFPVQLAEMFPVRPGRHQVGIGDQHARCIAVRAKHTDRLAGLNEQGFVVFQSLERLRDVVEAFPVARRFADAAVDDEVFRTLRHLRIEIVHEHPERRFR